MESENVETSAFPYRRVAVSGGTGTVAAVFLRALLEVPQVTAITTSRRRGSRADRLPASPRLRVVDGPLEDVDVLQALAGSGEIVYHLAAWLANTQLPADPTSIFVTNSLATAVLARLCARHQRRLVFTSSHSVYFAGTYAGRIREDAFAFRGDFLDWIAGVRAPYLDYADALLAGTAAFADAPRRLAEIHRQHPVPREPLIYDRDEYHLYCLTKLLAERFVLDHGGWVLRLSNVYGPGDASLQAVGEACDRILRARPGERLAVRQPFKKLVPCCLGDIVAALLAAGSVDLPPGVPRVFTVASQEAYLREDALLRAAAAARNALRGTDDRFDIETLPRDPTPVFTYDLSKLRRFLLPGHALMPFDRGVQAQMAWRLEQAGAVGSQMESSIQGA